MPSLDQVLAPPPDAPGDRQVLEGELVVRGDGRYARIDGSDALWGPLLGGGAAKDGDVIAVGVSQDGRLFCLYPATSEGGGANVDATASSTTLAPGVPATVNVTEPTPNLFDFAFGIPAGVQGPQGAQGNQGPAGPQGVKGDTGAQGPQGVQGPVGATGAQGPKGDTGAQGPKGDTGAQGPVGPPGTVYDTDQIGTVKTWTGKVIPNNWMLADGRVLQRVDYPQLADVFGIPVGQATFTLPDLRNRFIYGGDATLSNMYAAGGAATHTLAAGEMPGHTHTGTTNAADRALNHVHNYGADVMLIDQGGGSGGVTQVNMVRWAWPNSAGYTQNNPSPDHLHSFTTGNAGGNQPHNNMPPYVVLAHIIKATGVQVDTGGALKGATGAAGTSVPPPDSTKTQFKASPAIGPSASLTGQQEIYASAAGDMRFTITPTVNVWWRVEYRSIITLAADYGWCRQDLMVALGGSGEATDAQGNGTNRDIVAGHQVMTWMQGDVSVVFKCTAGKTYTTVPTWVPSHSGSYSWYRSPEHLNGQCAVVGYW